MALSLKTKSCYDANDMEVVITTTDSAANGDKVGITVTRFSVVYGETQCPIAGIEIRLLLCASVLNAIVTTP